MKIDKDSKNDPERRIRVVIGWGTDIAGGAAGGALGLLLGGPIGAVAAGAGGAAITRALVAAGEDICDRILSQREKKRVGAALAIAADKTRERLNNGDRGRDDDFVSNGSDRPPIEETTEGLLLAAQRAYDEKKVPFIATLLANLNFRQDLNVQAAAVLVRMVDQITYQQMCILRLAFENQCGTPLSGGKYQNRLKGPGHGAILSDILELERRGLINNGGNAVLGLIDLNPPSIKLQGFGVHIFDLMELKNIPKSDLDVIRNILNAADPTLRDVGLSAGQEFHGLSGFVYNKQKSS